MSQNDTNTSAQPRIIVMGIGGAGCNAVNNMVQSQLEGVEFIVANTDSQALQTTLADKAVCLGEQITQGLGAGAKPDIGRAAADESLESIEQSIDGAHMLFIAAAWEAAPEQVRHQSSLEKQKKWASLW